MAEANFTQNIYCDDLDQYTQVLNQIKRSHIPFVITELPETLRINIKYDFDPTGGSYVSLDQLLSIL